MFPTAPGRRQQQACLPTFSYVSFSSFRVYTHFLQNTSVPSHTNAWRCTASAQGSRVDAVGVWAGVGSCRVTACIGPAVTVCLWRKPVTHLGCVHLPPGLWPLLAADAAAWHLLHAARRRRGGLAPVKRGAPPPPLPPPCLQQYIRPLWPRVGPHRAGNNAQTASHVGARLSAGLRYEEGLGLGVWSGRCPPFDTASDLSVSDAQQKRNRSISN
jgi:hypothetical protein